MWKQLSARMPAFQPSRSAFSAASKAAPKSRNSMDGAAPSAAAPLPPATRRRKASPLRSTAATVASRAPSRRRRSPRRSGGAAGAPSPPPEGVRTMSPPAPTAAEKSPSGTHRKKCAFAVWLRSRGERPSDTSFATLIMRAQARRPRTPSAVPSAFRGRRSCSSAWRKSASGLPAWSCSARRAAISALSRSPERSAAAAMPR